MENVYCVYCHTNKLNNKKYYGQTKWVECPERRWGRGGNGYIGNKHFWNAICKYGWDNFEHEIIQTDLSLVEANRLETHLILKEKTYDRNFGYNLNFGGDNKAILEETKDKIREAAKQRTGEKNSFYGKHHTDETKQKISIKNRCKRTRLGKHHTEETKKKISESHKGNTAWNKGLIGIYHHTDKAKQKIGLSSKQRWENEEYRTKVINAKTGQKRSEEFKVKQAVNARGNTNVRGKHWYNNGVIEIRAIECPEGFSKGRCGPHVGVNQYTKNLASDNQCAKLISI